MRLVLASSSAVRARLLRDAGLDFTASSPGVDEDAVKTAFKAAGRSAPDLALELAQQKALAVPAPDALVIGADQVLVCNDDWFDKPKDMAGAREHLRNLRGKTHYLVGGVAVAENGKVVWAHASSVAMTMRAFSDSYLEHYLAQAGPAILTSVGAYQLEARGVHLFERIEGDYFAILGLALLPLFEFLRSRGAIGT
jgi:septum formation protein